MGRRRQDQFGRRAAAEGWEARSVYKLEEVQKRARILRPGQRVLDLGCHPGSWSQFTRQQVGRRGHIVGVDLTDTPGLAGQFIRASVLDLDTDYVLELLGGPADVVLSDMAPNTTGDRIGDHLRQIELARAALQIAVAVLGPGGTLVTKVFEGGEAADLVASARTHFAAVKRMRPKAVRKESREWFLVCTGRVS